MGDDGARHLEEATWPATTADDLADRIPFIALCLVVGWVAGALIDPIV